MTLDTTAAMRIHGCFFRLLLSTRNASRRRHSFAQVSSAIRCLRLRATQGSSASTASARRPISIAQVAIHQGRQVFAFTRPATSLRRSLRASWEPCGLALRRNRAGKARCRNRLRASWRACAARRRRSLSRFVLGGIHIERSSAHVYAILWGERRLQSVAFDAPGCRRFSVCH